MSTKKIIYIAGYGYSGSTLLERILATHPKVIGCGEVHNLLNDFQLKEICSCGSNLENCPFWKNVYDQYLENPLSLDTATIFSELSAHVSDDIYFFCDASKTTWGTLLRPYQLSKKYEVYLIHLTRNEKACLNSVLKRKGRSRMIFKALSLGLHWSLAHLMAYVFQINRSNHYIRVKYEDLSKNPEPVIVNLFQFLSLDSKSIGEKLANKMPIPLTHQLSGNAIRRKESLILQAPSTSNISINFLAKAILRVVSWPVRKLIGY